MIAIPAAIALGWFAAMAGILLLTERADAVLVVFSQEAGRTVLPGSVALLEWSGHRGKFVGMKEGYVRDLYAAGALAVLPARNGGCFSLRSSPRQKG